MWAMLQAAGAVLAKFGAKNPAVKWALIALVGLLAVEVVAERGIALMTAWQNYIIIRNDAAAKNAAPDNYEEWLKQHQANQQPTPPLSGPASYAAEVDRATRLLADTSLSPEARAELLTYRGIYYRLAHEADKAIVDLKAAIYLGASWRAVVSLVEAYLYKFSDVGIALCGLVVVVGFGGPWWERRQRRLKAAALMAAFEKYTQAREEHLGLGGADTPAHDQEPRP